MLKKPKRLLSRAWSAGTTNSVAQTHFVAKCVLLDSDGRFLLLTRSQTHPTLAGFYDLPGGMIELGEEPGDAVRREIHEETGLKVNRVSVMYATTMLIDEVSYPTLLYAGWIDEPCPEVVISWEHEAAEWAPMERLSEVEPQLAPTYREALNYIRENNILTDMPGCIDA